MESPPVRDPGAGNRPLGALAMVTAAVRCLEPIIHDSSYLGYQVEQGYRAFLTGEYVEPEEKFSTNLCGPRTVRFMEYITDDLTERHWDGIFRGLAAMSVKVAKKAAAKVGAPQAPRKRVPLHASDPPSPPAED